MDGALEFDIELIRASMQDFFLADWHAPDARIGRRFDDAYGERGERALAKGCHIRARIISGSPIVAGTSQ
jgi:hypothetical protein